MYVESFEKLSGNDRFEGFAVDLASELSKVLGFNFTFKLVDDGKVMRDRNRETERKCFDLSIFVSTAVRPRLVTGMGCWERFTMERRTSS